MKTPAAVFSGIFLLVVMLVVCGCGEPANTPALLPTAAPTAAASTASHSTWVPPTALAGTPIPGAVATLTAAPRLQSGTITITNTAGEQVKMTVEIADTEPSRELGLMFRDSMPPDAGMIFDFKGETTSGFWMQNTILPLSIAFVAQDGSIVSIADMQPLDTTTVNAAGPYYYAIEANQGFFRANNINSGDKVSLPVDTNVLVPGMPSVGK